MFNARRETDGIARPGLLIAALPPVTDPFDYESALAGCATRNTALLRRLYEHAAPYLLGVAVRIVRDRATAEDVLRPGPAWPSGLEGVHAMSR